MGKTIEECRKNYNEKKYNVQCRVPVNMGEFDRVTCKYITDDVIYRKWIRWTGYRTGRQALDAKLIGESETSPGYFKYQFTILELDGTTHEMPAYGKDMEDALERLVWVERVDKKPFNVVVISALLTIIIVPSVIAAITNSPLFLLGALALAIAYGFVMVRVDKYFNKK